MERFILKYRESILGGLAILFVGALVAGLGSAILSPTSAGAATSTVTVTATVSEWASIEVDKATPTISPALVSAAGVGAIGTATSTLTVGTNKTAGLTVTIKGAKAGDNPSALVGTGDDIVSASSTLSAGTDGYGAQCTIGTETACNEAYDKSGDNVSVIPGAGQAAATFLTGTLGTGRTATLTVKAASVVTRTAGDYADTITLTATPSS